jgi:NADPH-dependent ferric siderophore reductase
VRWLHRRGCPYGELLEQAFHELAIAPGETFVWGAGEAAALRRLRRHVRDDLEVPRADFEIGGYWVQRLSEDEGVARNRAAWEAALAAGKSEAEVEDALLY